MNISLQHSDFIVVDDFLDPKSFSLLWNFIQEETFRLVNGEKWIKAFRLTDGQPMWGSVYLSHADPDDISSAVYPCGRGIDLFIKAMLENETKCLVPYVGKHGTDWIRFFSRPYLYPPGSGLSWHTDGRGDVAGAFVFYAHPTWHAQWGAELLIDDSGFRHLDYPEMEMHGGTKKKLGLHLDNAPSNAAVMKRGLGHYVLAKPNRLVILKPGLLHRISRVDRCAGDNVRASLTGFFLREK